MNIRAIAIDLDHTLFNSQLEISEKDAEAIKLASEKGLYIIIATGRMPIVLNRALKHLVPYIDCMISYNGAIAMDVKTQELIYVQPVPFDACAELVLKFSSAKYNVLFFSDERVFSRNVAQDVILEHYVKRTNAQFEFCSNGKIPTGIPIHKFSFYDLEINKNYNHTLESQLETVDIFHNVVKNFLSNLTYCKFLL